MSLIASQTLSTGFNAGTATTSGIDTTGGKIIVVSIGAYNTMPSAVTDNKGNTFTALTTRASTIGSDKLYTRLFYCIAPTVGAGHTFSANGASAALYIHVMAFDNAVSGLQAESGTGGGSGISSLQPGSISPSSANSLFVSSSVNDNGGSPSVNSSFTALSTLNDSFGSGKIAAAYKVSSSSENPTWSYSSATNGRGAAVAMAVFNPPPPPSITTSSLSNCVRGRAYNPSALAFTGGTGSGTWSLDGSSDPLPAGLSIPSNGSDSWGTTTAPAGEYDIVVKVTDSLGQTDTQALTLTVIEAVTTKWSRGGFIPMPSAWWAADASDGTTAVTASDLAGNNDLTQNSSPPVITANVLNSNPAWVFNGSKNGLAGENDFTPQTIFIVASYSGATFSGAPVLLADSATPIDILKGVNGTTRFADPGDVKTYKLNGVEYPASNMQAPMSGEFGIIELTFNSPLLATDPTIGENIDTGSGSRWSGDVCEVITYDTEPSSTQLRRIYWYLCVKYFLQNLEWLWLDGLEIDDVSVKGEIIRKSFGGGNKRKALVGPEYLLHTFKLSSGALPGADKYGSLVDFNTKNRFDYYYDFFSRYTVGESDVFVIEFLNKFYSVGLVETEMPFSMHSYDLFSTDGVSIEQRYVPGVVYNDDGSLYIPADLSDFDF